MLNDLFKKVYDEGVEWVELEKILENIKYTNKIQKNKFLKHGKYPIIDQSSNFISGYWNDDKNLFKIKTPVIIFGDHTRIFKFINFNFIIGADGIKKEKILKIFLNL